MIEEIQPSVNRKANKEHICSWCGYKILKGETYKQAVLKGDNVFQWKEHLICDELTYLLDMYFDCGWNEGITSQDFMDNICEFYRENLNQDDDYDDIELDEAIKKIYAHLNKGE